MRELESRKRAPLYQKKQEEELRVANEKAAEAEVRAQDAELKAKDLKVTMQTVTGDGFRDLCVWCRHISVM